MFSRHISAAFLTRCHASVCGLCCARFGARKEPCLTRRYYRHSLKLATGYLLVDCTVVDLLICSMLLVSTSQAVDGMRRGTKLMRPCQCEVGLVASLINSDCHYADSFASAVDVNSMRSPPLRTSAPPRPSQMKDPSPAEIPAD
ncbi:hypothetical protein BU25DRAFT_19065 [Macroventuria anomochaeta]|uniref:Uncharacterized protein n=1 Tax=Macroventuria anomochaeta TaxID=301207 RepID=A0ACB6S7T5_9PLEO|nr:uncharacterized protein BU25DRAFT_19065 [Macroventuria anomochaeta]KAF2629274.1 hypothetical protein BU25DRAFT_19065 [Macroventuria anomochaeta]